MARHYFAGRGGLRCDCIPGTLLWARVSTSSRFGEQWIPCRLVKRNPTTVVVAFTVGPIGCTRRVALADCLPRCLEVSAT